MEAGGGGAYRVVRACHCVRLVDLGANVKSTWNNVKESFDRLAHLSVHRVPDSLYRVLLIEMDARGANLPHRHDIPCP